MAPRKNQKDKNENVVSEAMKKAMGTLDENSFRSYAIADYSIFSYVVDNPAKIGIYCPFKHDDDEYCKKKELNFGDMQILSCAQHGIYLPKDIIFASLTKDKTIKIYDIDQEIFDNMTISQRDKWTSTFKKVHKREPKLFYSKEHTPIALPYCSNKNCCSLKIGRSTSAYMVGTYIISCLTCVSSNTSLKAKTNLEHPIWYYIKPTKQDYELYFKSKTCDLDKDKIDFFLKYNYPKKKSLDDFFRSNETLEIGAFPLDDDVESTSDELEMDEAKQFFESTIQVAKTNSDEAENACSSGDDKKMHKRRMNIRKFCDNFLNWDNYLKILVSFKNEMIKKRMEKNGLDQDRQKSIGSASDDKPAVEQVKRPIKFDDEDDDDEDEDDSSTRDKNSGIKRARVKFDD